MKTQLLTILITDSTFRSNIFNGVKRVGNFLRDTVFGTPAELRTMDWRPWKWKEFNHIGGMRVNGGDAGQKELLSHQVGTKKPMNNLNGGWGFGGGASHDKRFASTDFGPKRALYDSMLTVDSALAIIPWRNAAPIIPSLMTGVGISLAAPFHFVGINL
ncbi:MAG: hypothetical protein CMF28_03195 [Kiritimatiellaceae bacterium]|nr:hypothetical protein [Kiritimatiellaceae bacterium]